VIDGITGLLTAPRLRSITLKKESPQDRTGAEKPARGTIMPCPPFSNIQPKLRGICAIVDRLPVQQPGEGCKPSIFVDHRASPRHVGF